MKGILEPPFPKTVPNPALRICSTLHVWCKMTDFLCVNLGHWVTSGQIIETILYQKIVLIAPQKGFKKSLKNVWLLIQQLNPGGVGGYLFFNDLKKKTPCSFFSYLWCRRRTQIGSLSKSTYCQTLTGCHFCLSFNFIDYFMFFSATPNITK